MAVSTANSAPSAGIIGFASPRTSSRSWRRTTWLAKRCPSTAAAIVTATHPTSSTHSGADTSQFMSTADEGHALVIARRDDDLVPEHVVEVLQHSLHGDRLQPARAVVERVVEEGEHAEERGDRGHDGAHQEALHHQPL